MRQPLEQAPQLPSGRGHMQPSGFCGPAGRAGSSSAFGAARPPIRSRHTTPSCTLRSYRCRLQSCRSGSGLLGSSGRTADPCTQRTRPCHCGWPAHTPGCTCTRESRGVSTTAAPALGKRSALRKRSLGALGPGGRVAALGTVLERGAKDGLAVAQEGDVGLDRNARACAVAFEAPCAAQVLAAAWRRVQEAVCGRAAGHYWRCPLDVPPCA